MCTLDSRCTLGDRLSWCRRFVRIYGCLERLLGPIGNDFKKEYNALYLFIL